MSWVQGMAYRDSSRHGFGIPRPKHPPKFNSYSRQSFERAVRVVKRKKEFDMENHPLSDYPTLRRIFDRKLGLLYNIFWGSALLICFCLCVYQIQDRLRMYMNAPILTSVKIVRREWIKYPDITICGNVYGPSSGITNLFQKYYEQLNVSTPCDVYVWDLLANTEVTVTEIWNATDMGTDLSIVNCSFDEAPNTKGQVGCHTSSVMTAEGKCVTYSIPNKVRFSSSSSFIITGEPSFNQCKSDLKILVHSDYLSPQLKALFADGKPASYTVGQNLQLLVTVTKFSYLNVPQNPCVDEQQSLSCLHRCLETNMVANLSCRLPYMFSSKVTLPPLCTDINSSRQTLKKNQEALLNENDVCRCPRKCEEMVYSSNFVTSESKTRTRFKMEIIMAENTLDIVTESYTYDTVALLCDIGGNMSLFLGTCLITVLELLELLLKNMRVGLQKLFA